MSRLQTALDKIERHLTSENAFGRVEYDAFLKRQCDLGLAHGSRPLCRHLAPYMIERQAYDAIVIASQLVTAALERVAKQARVDPALCRELGLDAAEEALLQIDQGYPQMVVVARLDALITESEAGKPTFHFIELNADSPAGLADQWLLARCLYALPHLTEVTEHERSYVPRPEIALLESLRAVYTAWGGAMEKPPIAIVDFREVGTQGEFRVLRDVFAAAGHRTVIADPDELDYDGARLTVRGDPIELVYRRVITQELLSRGGPAHALFRAYRDRTVCVANPFCTKPMNKKSAFAVLSDPRYASLFSLEQRDAIEKHVPWTRVVRPGQTVFQDQRVDLIPFVIDHRDELVLKPNDDYGGKGVLLGWNTSADEWRRAVEATRDVPLVVQERRRPRALRMPTFQEGGLSHEELSFDFCPFIFAGRVEGAVVRLSSTGITNVSAGASVTGMLVLDEEAQAEGGAHV